MHNFFEQDMKKSLFVLFSFLATMNAWSLNYCQSSAFGYGAAATGGAGGTVKTVTSGSALSSALSASGKAIIIITQDISITSMIKVKATDKTLMALPGVTISNLKQDASNSGILYFKSGSKNLIIRNLTFIGPGAYDCDGNDLLCFDGVTNAWVDHCDFQDGCDGNFDNKGTTDNVTVSWCRFRYLKAPKAGGTGGSDDHRYTNLLGSGSSDKPSDGTYNMTWAYCWWDSGCKERMVRCRNASLHFLNCYWNSSVANYYIGPENVDCYLEGCYIEGKASKANIFKSYGGKNGLTCKDCYSKNGLPTASGRTVVIPTYSYEAVSYTDAKSMVSNTSCGAGATLTVTTAGAISSSCDGSTPQPEAAPTLDDPNNKSQAINAGTAISNITFTASGTATSISVSNLPAGLTSSKSGLTITIKGTPTASGSYTVTVKNAGGATSEESGYITVNPREVPVDPTTPTDIVQNSTWWNFSDADFRGLSGDLTRDTVIRQFHINATADEKMKANSSSKKIDDIQFSYRLQMVGEGSTDRHFWFDVKGACTMDVYMIASNSSATYKMNMAVGAFGVVAQSVDVPGSAIAKYTFTYTGSQAVRIYLYPSNGGINMYGVRLTYSSTPDPGPTPPSPAGEHSFTWNISNPNFAAFAGDIAATTTVDGLTIVATSSGKVTIDEQEIKYGFAEGDTVVFVNRLKTGGSGKADCRHIKFAVTGNCTIEVWAKSSSSSEDRTINIYTNSLDSKNLIGTLPAPKGDLTKQSFTYTGGPTTIVMGSASSGINFYAINIVYPSPTDLQRAKESLMPNKIIRNGQLFIRHNGHYYNCVGQPVCR